MPAGRPRRWGLQANVGLIRIDQLQRLLAGIHVFSRLDEVVVHHPVERGKDVASAQLLLNLAHLYPRQPLGQFSLLHVVTSLVILALGGALLAVQRRQPAKLGAGEAHVTLPLGLLGLGLLQREPQRRTVEAQQLIPLLTWLPNSAIHSTLPLTSALSAACWRLATVPLTQMLAAASPGHVRQGHHLALGQRGEHAPASSATPTTILVKPCVIDELLAQARWRRASGDSTRSPSRRKAGNRIRVNRVQQLMPPTMTVASPR